MPFRVCASQDASASTRPRRLGRRLGLASEPEPPDRHSGHDRPTKAGEDDPPLLDGEREPHDPQRRESAREQERAAQPGHPLGSEETTDHEAGRARHSDQDRDQRPELFGHSLAGYEDREDRERDERCHQSSEQRSVQGLQPGPALLLGHDLSPSAGRAPPMRALPLPRAPTPAARASRRATPPGSRSCSVLRAADALADHARHERARDLHDVDVRVQPPRDTLDRGERLDQQSVAPGHRDPVAPQQLQEPEPEVAEVGVPAPAHGLVEQLAELAAHGRDLLGRHDDAEVRGVAQRAVGVAVHEAGEHLRDVSALGVGEVPDDAEVQVGDAAVGRHEQVRGVQVGVEPPVRASPAA